MRRRNVTRHSPSSRRASSGQWRRRCGSRIAEARASPRTRWGGQDAHGDAAAAKLDGFPCVVVCPSQVKAVWSDEIAQVCPSAKVEIVSGRKGETPPGSDFYIINRDILADRSSRSCSTCVPARWLLTRPTAAGGYGTAMLKAMWALSEAAQAGGGVMPVTGTPVTNDYTY